MRKRKQTPAPAYWGFIFDRPIPHAFAWRWGWPQWKIFYLYPHFYFSIYIILQTNSTFASGDYQQVWNAKFAQFIDAFVDWEALCKVSDWKCAEKTQIWILEYDSGWIMQNWCGEEIPCRFSTSVCVNTAANFSD